GEISVRSSAAGGRARIAVSDQGIGIPRSEHERIFEKFYRLDPSLARGVGGSGLGLYISRELIQRMGGRLLVESSVGGGSTFTVELPLGERSPARSRKAASPRRPTSRPARRRQG